MTSTGDEGLYFRQLLAGESFATGDQVARQMVNFVYAVGDRATGEALLVDPAYDVGALVELLAADGMRCVGVLATHYHADHVGGLLGGHPIEGIVELLDRVDVPIHVQRTELPWIERSTGVGSDQLVAHAGGDVVAAGSIEVQLLHTPGHTPGGQCFFVRNRLVAGDTLFLQGCGRVDLPGSDPEAMYESLTTRLSRIPDDAVLYPGHRYAPQPSASMGETRRENVAFVPKSLDQWLAMFADA
jgi:glyoxylase-like metal-dependent hydrolase (beta-lactamase superfamily II)